MDNRTVIIIDHEQRAAFIRTGKGPEILLLDVVFEQARGIKEVRGSPNEPWQQVAPSGEGIYTIKGRYCGVQF